jgi:hypothetical protein
MSKSTREIVKRHMEYAERDVFRAMLQVVRAGGIYETVHPGIYEKFCQVVAGLQITARVIKALSDSI